MELHIDVDPSGDGHRDNVHVIGTLKPDGGRPVTFVGWIALLALLQEAIADLPPAPAPRSPAAP
jgi:hypothetical protein